jgi:ferrous iron transport protein B
LPELKQAIAAFNRKKHAVFGYSNRLESDIDEVVTLLHGEYILSKKSLALLLLQRDEEVAEIVMRTEGDNYAVVEEKVREKIFSRRDSFHLDLSMERKAVVRGLLNGVFHKPPTPKVLGTPFHRPSAR